MKRWITAFIAIASGLLTGCAATVVRSDVTAFHEWPADLQEKSYLFERTTEQKNNLEYRRYENLVRDELRRLGFVGVENPSSAKLKVSMRYSIGVRDVTVVQPVIDYPFWYGSPFYGPGWRGYYGPFHDPFWYGPPMPEYREISYQIFKRQLRVVITRLADLKNLYDVTVDSEGSSGSLSAVMPYMVRSAFANFPGINGVPHRIELEMQR